MLVGRRGNQVGHGPIPCAWPPPVPAPYLPFELLLVWPVTQKLFAMGNPKKGPQKTQLLGSFGHTNSPTTIRWQFVGGDTYVYTYMAYIYIPLLSDSRVASDGQGRSERAGGLMVQLCYAMLGLCM